LLLVLFKAKPTTLVTTIIFFLEFHSDWKQKMQQPQQQQPATNNPITTPTKTMLFAQQVQRALEECGAKYPLGEDAHISKKLHAQKQLLCCNCGLGVYHRFGVIPAFERKQLPPDGKDYIRLPWKYNADIDQWQYWPGLVACSFNCCLGYMLRSVHWMPAKTPFLFHRNLVDRYGAKLLVASAPPLECFLHTHYQHIISPPDPFASLKMDMRMDEKHSLLGRNNSSLPALSTSLSSSSSSSASSSSLWSTGIPVSTAYKIYQVPAFQFAVECATGAVPPHPFELAAYINGDDLPEFCITRYYHLLQLPGFDISRQVVFDANSDSDFSIDWKEKGTTTTVDHSSIEKKDKKEKEGGNPEEEDEESETDTDDDLETLLEGIEFESLAEIPQDENEDDDNNESQEDDEEINSISASLAQTSMSNKTTHHPV